MSNTTRTENIYKIWQQKLSNWTRGTTDTETIKISSILAILYLPAGLFTYKLIQGYSLPYLIILYLLFIYNVIGVAATINEADAQPLENFYFMSSGSIVLISLLIAHYHKDYLWDLYRQVIEYQNTPEFNNLSDAIIRGKLKLISLVISIPVLFIISVPLYAIIFTDAKTNELIVLLYPMWYPWTRDTTSKYLCSLLLQFISVLYGYYLMAFLLGSFGLATLFIRIRFVLLGREISQIADTAVVQKSETPCTISQHHRHQKMYEKFSRIVSKHIALIRFIRRTISCFTLMASILVAYAIMTAALLITLFLENDVSTLLKVKLLSTSIVAVISLGVCCICGDLLLRLNRDLMEAIYNTPWYTFSINLRKSIVTFMIQNQMEFEMNSFGICLLCKPYLGTVFKLLYSCIQFLRQRAD